MKRLLISSTPLLLLSLYINAQKIIHKPVTIFDGSSSLLSAGKPHVINLDRTVEDSDTSYTLLFDDQQYSELVDIKHIQFANKDQLRAFAKTLRLAEKSNFSERVANYLSDKNGYIISKVKVGLGTISYQIFSDDGYCYLNTKKAEKLLKVIDSE